MRPMDMEHNLRLILDQTPENVRIFPSDKLLDEPFVGPAYVWARMLLPKIYLEFCEAISKCCKVNQSGQ